MENRVYATEAPAANSVGTYDFNSPVARVKAIDLAMRLYFGADNWLAIRNRLFPGLRAPVYQRPSKTEY